MTETKKLDPRAKKSWFIGRLIGLIILGLIYAGGWVFLKVPVGKYIWIYLLIGGIILAAQLASTLIYPAIEYRQWKYSIDEDKVQIVHGVYFITTSVIPVIRIQHVEIQQGPINRQLSLANISIKTAGGGVSIPCIHKDEAEKLAEYINEKTILKVTERIKKELEGNGGSHE